ncbi:MAG: VanZ family protein [Stomatobaculum sp.]|nr:VanZ family protein [Stomatobaculum sp.]
MRRIRPRHRGAGILLFLIYLVGLSYFLFFSEALGRTGTEESHYNLELFKEILRFWNYREQLGWQALVLNTAGNVAVFFPFGFLLPVILGKRCGFPAVILTGCLFSLVIEMTQYYTRTGRFDVDDILLNTLGAGLGYLLFLICYHALPPAEGGAE